MNKKISAPLAMTIILVILLLSGIIMAYPYLYPKLIRSIKSTTANTPKEITDGPYFYYGLYTKYYFSNFNISNQEIKNFYIIKNSVNGKKYLADADQIARIVKTKRMPEPTEGDRFLFAKIINELPNYPITFSEIPWTWLDSTDLKCNEVNENCFLELLASFVDTNIDSVQIEKITANTMNVSPKSGVDYGSRGCRATSYYLIQYNQIWQTLDASMLCLD